MTIKEKVREHIAAIEVIANRDGFDAVWIEAMSQVKECVERRGHTVGELNKILKQMTPGAL